MPYIDIHYGFSVNGVAEIHTDILKNTELNAFYKIYPERMSYDNRIRCLHDLKEIGYQTGCGFMVGSPYQTAENLVEDLRFIKNFNPEMCGIGPFIPHKNTPFKDFQAGSLDLTLKMLALVRLLVPDVLLPATTALATISENGRELGLKAGANVIMPNLLPKSIAKKYSLYDNKFHEENDIEKLKQELERMGYQFVISRGDNARKINSLFTSMGDKVRMEKKNIKMQICVYLELVERGKSFYTKLMILRYRLLNE